MGRGSKHSKNAGVMGSEALSYAEKKALGYGTVKERLGKDSLGNYYDCCLTLKPAEDPVVGPSGHVFSREAILENLLAQKKANKRKLKAWEAQQQEERRKEADKKAIEAEAAVLAFDRQNHMGASDALAVRLRETISEEAEALLADKRVASGAVNIRENEDRIKEMKAFWLPSQAPEVKAMLEKPDMATYCPASGKKLSLKQLIPLKFTPVPDGGPHEFMDPVTRDLFTNASRLVLLKPTGDVVHHDTWTKLIRGEGQYDGQPISEDDVVELQRGGTGFAAHNADALQAKAFFHLGPGSGMADLRGQHQGPRSHFGLRFTN